MLDPLTLDQMRVLIAVAEAGSFSAAARRLGRVQSAISQSVNALEAALGATLFDRSGKVPRLNDAGRVLLEDARRLVQGAQMLKARAESIAADIEPELTLAVDAIFPNVLLMAGLKALAGVFPLLPVTLFTEGLGGAEQRLRDGVARLGLYVPFEEVGEDRETEFLMNIPTVPVVAAGHPLAAERGPLTRDRLAPHLQLVLTDRTPLTAGISRGIIGRRTWRFADLGTRREFLLAGFGWCNMPGHMVSADIAAGRLRVLALKDIGPPPFAVYVVHERARPLGRASRWLVEELRRLMPQYVEPLLLAETAR